MKNKSIEEQVVKRLLAKEYPKELLISLYILNEQVCTNKYSKEEFLKLVPFLEESDIKTTELDKIRKNIRDMIVEKINIIAAEKKVAFYEMSILVYALENIETATEKEEQEIIHKNNPKIKFCYDYVEMTIFRYSKEEKVAEMLKRLKMFD